MLYEEQTPNVAVIVDLVYAILDALATRAGIVVNLSSVNKDWGLYRLSK